LAAEPEVARLVLAADALEAVVRGVLPMKVRLPAGMAGPAGTRFSMTEVKYCGGGPKGSARLRAVGTLADSVPRPTVVLVCRGSLSEVAEPAKPALAEDTVLIDLEASWQNWDLKAALVHALIVGKEGQSRAWSAGDKRLDLGVVSTADLRVDDATGAPIVLHASPTFRAGAVEIALALSDKRPSKPPPLPSSELKHPDQANASVEIPLAMANRILGLLTAKQPLSIPLEREQVDVRGLVLSGEGSREAGRLTLSGIATPQSLDEDARWTLTATGEPTRVASFKVSAQYEDCDRLGTLAAVACNVRNGARTAGAEALGAAATRRYQGQLVHETANPLDLRLTFAGQRIALAGQLVRMWLSQRGLCAAAQLGPSR
jgi:hypothetical protein